MRVAVAVVLVALVACSSGLRRVRRLPRNLWDNPKYATIDEDESKIVGGQTAQEGQFPYQTSYQGFGSHSCGGALVGENGDVVLTAAHCCEGLGSGSFYTMTAGEHNLNTDSGNEQTHTIGEANSHPDYSAFTLVNDVCLCHLSGAFEHNEHVQPAVLPDAGYEPADDSMATVSGWGATTEGGSLPAQLQFVEVPIVPFDVCNEAYSGDIDPDTMICAGEGGKDSCQGDSGGPMYCHDGQVHCGVVSWGIGCARPEYPGVYAKTSQYTRWIRETMAKWNTK